MTNATTVVMSQQCHELYPWTSFSVTSISGTGSVATAIATNTLKAGDPVVFSGFTGAWVALNGTPTTVASASGSSSPSTTNDLGGDLDRYGGGAAYAINNDVYGLATDTTHFGDPNDSAGKVDGQRAHANEVIERLGYTQSIPQPYPQPTVALTTGTNWLCPQTGVYLVTVTGAGGQGGGGGANAAGAAQQGGGGGGAGAITQQLQSLTAGTLYPYVIGVGGTGSGAGGVAGSHAGSAGASGGDTTWNTSFSPRAAPLAAVAVAVVRLPTQR